MCDVLDRPICVLMLKCIQYATWLGQPSNKARLVAAGYSAELVAQLAASLRAPELVAAGDAQISNDPTELLAALRNVGTGLTTLALPQCCNNPSCGNTSKQTELELVSKRSCKCSQCRVAHYCGKSCQRQHWKQHKAVCKALAAAAAPPPPPPSAATTAAHAGSSS
jgi:hypothetical protein